MKIAMGSDHAGLELKEKLKSHLTGAGVEVDDFGTTGSESVDYPDFAFKAAGAVACGECDYGVLVCSTGVGMCVAANKVRGVRAALASDVDTAAQSRAHVDCNVLVLGQKLIDSGTAIAVLDRWLNTPFEGGRHGRRVGKITDFENSQAG
ncbi:MAG: ribose 5-phosphate isomerase B [Candidatus Eisenbacteria bacterium]